MSKKSRAARRPEKCTLIMDDEVEMEQRIEKEEASQANRAVSPEEAGALSAIKKQLAELKKRDRIVYYFMPVNQGMKIEYEEWLEGRARDAAIKTANALRKKARQLRIRVNDASLDDDERLELAREAKGLEDTAADHMAKLDERITAGVYEFAGAVCIRAWNTDEGISRLAQMMLREKHGDMSLEDVTDLVREHYTEVTDAMRRANDSGNQSPSETEEMPPTD